MSNIYPYRPQQRYHAKCRRVLTIAFYTNSADDGALYDYLFMQPCKAAYIKSLIAADMMRAKRQGLL